MTARTDIAVDYIDSPRILEVDAPSVEMTMQDLVDTARDQEQSFQGLSYLKLVNASGKEDLGGGVSVGITVAQQNMRLAFEGRTTPVETGTVTTNPGSPVTGRDSFTDSGALFETNNVARGSLVINFTDQSVAEVYSVDSETKLTTKTLVNGIGNTFDASDVYHVFNIIQCNATGGNLVSVDEAQSSIPAILPTAFTQVVLTASSSATTQSQEVLEHAVFAEKVTIDQTNSTGLAAAGTVYPAGTTLQPSLTLADAKTIAAREGFSTLSFKGNYTFSGSDDIDTFTCIGEGPSLTILDLGATTSTIRTQFENAELTGDVNGAINVLNCHLEDVTGIGSATYETNFHNCLLEPGTVLTLDTIASLKTIHLVACDSGSPGDVPVTIDHNGSSADMTVRKYSGGILFENITDGTVAISYDGDSHLTLDSTCSAGAIAVRGDIIITDNSTGTFAITDQTSSALVWAHNKALTLQKWLGLR